MSTHGHRTETLIGAAVVLVGALVLVLTSFNRYESDEGVGTYQVKAVFQRADGIGVGTPVRLSGIPVGRVTGHELNENYQAVVTMSLNLDRELSDDTAAKILTDGLLGSKHIELISSGDGFDVIPSGETLVYTQDSVIIEDLLSKVVAMAKARRGIEDIPPAGSRPPPPGPPPPGNMGVPPPPGGPFPGLDPLGPPGGRPPAPWEHPPASGESDSPGQGQAPDAIDPQGNTEQGDPATDPALDTWNTQGDRSEKVIMESRSDGKGETW